MELWANIILNLSKQASSSSNGEYSIYRVAMIIKKSQYRKNKVLHILLLLYQSSPAQLLFPFQERKN